jgi:hypothetical protein
MQGVSFLKKNRNSCVFFVLCVPLGTEELMLRRAPFSRHSREDGNPSEPAHKDSDLTPV